VNAISQPVVLAIADPDGVTRTAPVPPDASLCIGRDPTCEVVLPSPLVSRRHAVASCADSGIVLTDTSANGTLVGKAVVLGQSVEVAPGIPIGIGPFRLWVMGRAGSSPPVPAPDGSQPGAAVRSLEVSAGVRRELHRRLIAHLDLVKLERSRMNEHALRARVRLSLQEIVKEADHLLPLGVDRQAVVGELTDEALGLGPLEALLADPAVSEIMVIDPRTIYVERGGCIEKTELRFTDDESVRTVLERIVTPLGRRIDESAPLLDARLRDGSRVNAVIPPLALRGTSITIRKFSKKPWTAEDLIRFGSLTPRMARFLQRSVQVRKNVIVTGGTGSGKTTLLNVLSASIPEGERIVTIEDSAELRLMQPHVVPLEARPSNMEGRGEITIRQLVKNAMRMRPDRIVVGECRGGEALDMLQAMNTGHDGSMTTLHANNPPEALKRLETLALMAGIDLPSRAIRSQIAEIVHLIVHQNRFADGTRRITSIAEVAGIEDDEITTREIFGYRRTGTGRDGTVEGAYYATGYLPSYLEDFVVHGFIAPDGDLL
jgi:pilus assembly protein CpaF